MSSFCHSRECGNPFKRIIYGSPIRSGMTSERGFTIIELILVVAVVVVMAAISSPFYSRFLLQNSVDNTTNQMMGTLRKAQIYSMMGKQNSGWAVNYSSNTITLYKGAPPFSSRPAPALDETFSVNSNVTVSITGGITDISFAKITGLPTPNTGPTITVNSGNNTKTITVNAQGVITR